MWPRIFKIGAIVGKVRHETFQLVREWKHRSKPILKIREPGEREQVRDTVTIAVANLPKEPQNWTNPAWVLGGGEPDRQKYAFATFSVAICKCCKEWHGFMPSLLRCTKTR